MNFRRLSGKYYINFVLQKRKEYMEKNKNTSGHLIAFLTILIWGTTFISTKILLRAFNPFEVLFFRFTIGLAALTIFYPKRLKLKNKKQEIIFACAGLCGVSLYYLLENVALTYSVVSNVGVIVSIAPLFTAILASRFLDGETLRLNFLIGFLTAIVGIGFISFSGSSMIKVNPIGDILAVLAALLWAVYSILTKKISAYGYRTIQTTRRIFFYGVLFMSPTLFISHSSLKLERFENPLYLFNILFLGLGASALCFVTWNYAVKLLGAVTTSVYIYLVPVISLITAVIILKERITWATAVGAVLTMAGLFISKSEIGLKKKTMQKNVVSVPLPEQGLDK
jgi:Permeases of the drug/metabolite transporter (DMT) superfamily